MRRGRALAIGSILALSKLSSLFTYSCKRASARLRFSCARADVPLIGPKPMPWFLRTALGPTAHRCLLLFFLCSSVIGRPRPAALSVLSLASELSPPPMWPCNPQLHLSTFHRIEHSLINLFRSYLSHGFYDLNSIPL
jgi:hypothetical protein